MTYNKFLNINNAWIENKIDACIDLAYCYNQVKCKDMYLSSLFRSFELDKPRAKVCSLIGIHFMQKEKYDLAIYYFKLALKDKINYKSGGIRATLGVTPLVEGLPPFAPNTSSER